jgi:hypothetical protein
LCQQGADCFDHGIPPLAIQTQGSRYVTKQSVCQRQNAVLERESLDFWGDHEKKSDACADETART